MSQIFLDYQSTTPMDSRVLRAMLPFFTEAFGNPHSTEHAFGVQAHQAIDRALAQIARVIDAAGEDIVITSGATEANNLALRGIISRSKKSHIVSCVTEHKSVLETLDDLRSDGHEVSLVSVGADGLIDVEALRQALRPTTRLVSIMVVNSEIGVVQPIAEIGEMCRSQGIPFHVDAAQGFGRIPLSVEREQIDLLSISAHKIYGPKGIGALYVAPAIRSRVRPMLTGGGQQRGLRAGTMPTPLIVGFGVAAELMQELGTTERARIAGLQARLWTALTDAVDGVHLNGSADQRVTGNLNFRIDDVDADSLLLLLPGLALSTGAACSSGAPEPSPVLQALGLRRDEASQSVRLGLGRMTTEEEVDTAAGLMADAIRRIRGGAPDLATVAR